MTTIPQVTRLARFFGGVEECLPKHFARSTQIIGGLVWSLAECEGDAVRLTALPAYDLQFKPLGQPDNYTARRCDEGILSVRLFVQKKASNQARNEGFVFVEALKMFFQKYRQRLRLQAYSPSTGSMTLSSDSDIVITYKTDWFVRVM